MSIGYTPAMPSVTNDSKVHERKNESQQRAIQEFNHQLQSEAASDDRDADGRQAWQWNQRQLKQHTHQDHKAPDISGQTGISLDLDG